MFSWSLVTFSMMLLMSSNFHLYVKHSGHYIVENFDSVLLKSVDFYYCMLLICLILLKLVTYFAQIDLG